MKKECMQKFVAEKTLTIRHKIVKMITPKVFHASVWLNELVVNTPRPMIVIAKAHFKHTDLIGAEIGVFQGDNALSILQTLPIKTLYLIDSYSTYYIEDGKRIPLTEAHSTAKEKMSSFSSQIKFIVKTSDKACKDIHEPLDFLYIDGNHTYDFVKRDITNYYPLIKPGGIIGGHDYRRDWLNGVAKASKEFAIENNLELNTIYPDWWIIKK